jgi:hypothetical protein
MKKILIFLVAMCCIFDTLAAELACEEVFENGNVKKATVYIDKKSKRIELTTSDTFKCNIYKMTDEKYYSGCPNPFMPEARGQEEMAVTVDRKTLDVDFRFGLSEGQTYNFKCKISESKI